MQNENGRKNIDSFEEKLGQLLNIVQDIQSKLSIQDQQNLGDDIKFIDKDWYLDASFTKWNKNLSKIKQYFHQNED